MAAPDRIPRNVARSWLGPGNALRHREEKERKKRKHVHENPSNPSIKPLLYDKLPEILIVEGGARPPHPPGDPFEGNKAVFAAVFELEKVKI